MKFTDSSPLHQFAEEWFSTHLTNMRLEEIVDFIMISSTVQQKGIYILIYYLDYRFLYLLNT